MRKSLVFVLLILNVVTACTAKKNAVPKSTVDALIDYSIVDNLGNDYFNFQKTKEKIFVDDPINNSYQPRGIGGGGAFSGLSFSPYSSLWFVGTDMGTLFRSPNKGRSWYPVNHFQTHFSSDLTTSVEIGFSANPNIVFHAPGGKFPQRSIDGGISWKMITQFELDDNEHIKYWRGHSFNPNIIFAGTNKGLYYSNNAGESFNKMIQISGDSKGTYLDYLNDSFYIYHATEKGIYKSNDEGRSFKLIYNPLKFKIRLFTAGRDERGVTFLFADNQGADACRFMFDPTISTADWNSHLEHCGYLWIAKNEVGYQKTSQAVGDHLVMAENDSSSIYFTGSTKWIKQYGTKVYSSIDGGKSFQLKFNQLDWDVVPFRPWPKDKLEYSAIALDIGWWDSGYENFVVNLRNSKLVGGTGNFFVHVSANNGDTWKAPFTRFYDIGERSENKKWTSTGLEVNTIYRLKFHPNNSRLAFAAAADIGGLITEDAGKSFKIIKTEFNSLYDFAFDRKHSNVIYAAAGAQHDFPSEWHGYVTNAEGGILKSNDSGKSWIKLTKEEFNRQYLTVAFDDQNEIIYAGTQGNGVVVSYDQGKTFQYLNEGLPNSFKIIPRIILDPETNDVYALVSGDAPYFTNYNETGIYFLKQGDNHWQLLRKNIQRPALEDEETPLWYYPIDFAIDFKSNSKATMYLIDYENNKNWLSTGIWKSENRGDDWTRMAQYTHPLSIEINPFHNNEIFVNGLWSVDGKWGDGGLFYSYDFGKTWKKNLKVPYQSNGRSSTIDPSNPNKIFYTFFGNSLMYGPKPN